MASKKYQINVVQSNDTWTAQITRQVTSLKVHVSKEQSDFKTESEATAWADEALTEFVNTQKSANQRKGSSRKESEEVKRQRSARRSEKTEAVKLAKEEAKNAEAMEGIDEDGL
jgi:hypothetical protein